MKRAIFIAPFDELSEPVRVAELAERAERRGWDGFFVWDHIDYRPPVSALADPWITSEAVTSSRACSATRQVRRSSPARSG
jgi:alkanesulfonate monooxygenase SsuD/methylene tetrahydromethanopterin reductase-like flavin-dependent oxidoreductase (luciferase family)